MKSLYKTNKRHYEEMGEYAAFYNPPDEFEQWKETKVATIKSGEESDGQDVEVFETRAPARFFKIRALPGKNSVGEDQPGYEMSTGSGSKTALWAMMTAVLISEGMVGISDDTIIEM